MIEKRTIMFVCIGNTCRSPMAEFIAKEIFNDNNYILSCGLYVIEDILNISAVKVIKDKLKIDIADKKPSSINNVDLKKIDTIYSLDKEVSSYLNNSNLFSGNIIELFVKDPYGQNIVSYYNTYNELFSKLKTIAIEKGSI